MNQTLTMTIGLPGSGKSTWVKKNIDITTTFVICRDDIRRMGCAGDYIFLSAREPMIMNMSRDMIVTALLRGYDVVLDETMITRAYRAQIFSLIDSMGIGLTTKIKGVYFDTPVSVCIDRRVKDDKNGTDDWTFIINGMYSKFEIPSLFEFNEFEVIKYEA